MSENVNVTVTQEQIDAAVERIEALAKAKDELARKESELAIHDADLMGIEKTYGVDSKEYAAKKVVVSVADEAKVELEKKVAELTFKKSELKPIVEKLSKDFDASLKEEQERVYDVEFGDCERDEEGNVTAPSQNGKKNFKQIMEYLNKDVEWTPTSAPGLMMLISNLEENRVRVQSAKFDGVVKLRSANILVLWNSITKGLSGKGFYTAKVFLTLWAACGKALSDAVTKVNNGHVDTRKIGTLLNTIQDAFDAAENDLPENDAPTTKDEVDPEA